MVDMAPQQQHRGYKQVVALVRALQRYVNGTDNDCHIALCHEIWSLWGRGVKSMQYHYNPNVLNV